MHNCNDGNQWLKEATQKYTTFAGIEFIKMSRILVKTFQGLEAVLAQEIIALGGREIEVGNRAVHCKGDLRFEYRVNYESRTALSVLRPITAGRIFNEKHLYDLVYAIPWYKLFSINKTILVEAVCFSENFKHSHFVALKSKDAIVDQFRDRYRKRPSISKSPDIRVNIFIKGDQCTVSLNTSGDPLFKRGYRLKTGDAPLNEVLAAGLIKLSGWDQQTPLVDPMCGSGTLAIEAGMLATQKPAQQGRDHFSFQHFKDFDNSLWKQVKKEADDRESDWKGVIRGMDRDEGILRSARQNALNAGLRCIKFRSGDFFNWTPSGTPGMIIMNPPYDVRMPVQDTINFYAQIGSHFKTHTQGWKAFLISSHLQAIKRIGLKPGLKKTVFNGPLECRFVGFDLFAGKRKVHLQSKRQE